MRVYRVEDQNGVGPWAYIGGRESSLLCMKDIYEAAAKAFTGAVGHDIPGMTYGDHRQFACHTIECFYKWWPSIEGRKALVEAGARLAVYEVPADAVAVCIMDTQCVYEPSAARLVGVLDPVTLEEKEIGYEVAGLGVATQQP